MSPRRRRLSHVAPLYSRGKWYQPLPRETQQGLVPICTTTLKKVVLPAHPKTAELKETMANLGGLGTLMSGSGPTVFTLTATAEEAIAIAQRLKAAVPDPDLGIWTSQFAPSGIQLDG